MKKTDADYEVKITIKIQISAGCLMCNTIFLATIWPCIA